MNLVLFDFDDTVTTLDTTLLFGVFAVRKRRVRYRLVLLFAALMLAKGRVFSNTRLKQIFAWLLARGQTEDHLHDLAWAFHDAYAKTLIDEGVLKALRAHVERGDHVYLVSANFDFVLKPLIERWSLAGVIATQTEYRESLCTGNIRGTACHGDEKLRRAVVHFGAATLAKAIAYGNQDDAPLLNAVQTGYVIRRPRPSFPLGLLRRYCGIFFGRLDWAGLATGAKIDPYPASGSSKMTPIL